MAKNAKDLINESKIAEAAVSNATKDVATAETAEYDVEFEKMFIE